MDIKVAIYNNYDIINFMKPRVPQPPESMPLMVPSPEGSPVVRKISEMAKLVGRAVIHGLALSGLKSGNPHSEDYFLQWNAEQQPSANIEE